jgi:hypothetical protein
MPERDEYERKGIGVVFVWHVGVNANTVPIIWASRWTLRHTGLGIRFHAVQKVSEIKCAQISLA